MTNDQDVDGRDHEGDVKEVEGDGEKNVIEGKGDVDDDEDIDDAVSPPPDLLSTAPNCQNPFPPSSQECS